MYQPDQLPSRRCFIKLGLVVGTSLSSLGWADLDAVAAGGRADVGARIVRTGCPAHNCGGRCLLKLHIRDGTIVRIETDDRSTDTIEAPQLRACVRGRAYRHRQYHPDRLLRPLKRVGRRGEGKFQPISWAEALDKVAGEIARVRKAFGSAALFVPYGTGSYSQTNGRQVAQRLMNLSGGSLGHLQQLLVGVHGAGDRDGVRHDGHRQ